MVWYPPVLDNRKVLLNHLCAKVWPLCDSKVFAKDICSKITKDLSDQEIIRLLENEVALEEAVCSAVSLNVTPDSKQVIGEKIFANVAKFESELCAQITGMLLELDEVTLESLLLKEESLRIAVEKAKKEYLLYIQQKQLGKTTEDVGEILYTLVSRNHGDPDLAAHLTGMLLELETCQLESLLQHPEQLRLKLEVAHKALTEVCDYETASKLS